MQNFIKYKSFLKLILIILFISILSFQITCNYIRIDSNFLKVNNNLNKKVYNYKNLLKNDTEKKDNFDKEIIYYNYSKNSYEKINDYNKPKIILFDHFEKKDELYIIEENNTKVYKIVNNIKEEIFSTSILYEYIVNFKPYIITTSNNIYILNDNENGFQKISLQGINKNATLTCSELVKINEKNFILVGTSHHGLYFKEKNENSFKLLFSGIARVPFTSNSTSYFETISDIIFYKNLILLSYKYSPKIGILYFDKDNKLNYYKGLIDIRNFNISDSILKKDGNIEYNNKLESLENINIINDLINFKSNENIYQIKIEELNIDEKNKDNEVINSNNNENKFVYTINNKYYKFLRINTYPIEKRENPSYSDFTRGLYIPPHHLSNKEKIKKKIEFLKSLNLNTIVVDLKDDFGYITYNSNSQIAKKIKSIKKIVDLENLLFLAHNENIKIIARIVCFRDPFLFSYENGKYAFYDKRTNSPWIGLEKERWVDPASDFVTDYIVEISKELESLGIDEIQFDYVRYPSDGGISNIYSIFNKENYPKNIILYKFLLKVKQNTSNIKISTDFYGYQCFYYITKHIGQDLYLLSNLIDVIYPMYYPSHFTKGFYENNLNQYETNFYIYNHGVQRAFLNTKKPLMVRPWVQVFKMKVSIDYKDYIQAQVDGILKAGYNSFIFWNPAGIYDILKEIKY